VKKRHSTHSKRDNRDDIVEEPDEKDESPQVARMTAVQKWTSSVEEPVELPFPVGGDVLGRLSVIEEAMKRVVAQVELIATVVPVVQTFDKRLLFEVERRDIVMSSQKDDIEQLKLEAETLVTRLKQVVEGDRLAAVSERAEGRGPLLGGHLAALLERATEQGGGCLVVEDERAPVVGDQGRRGEVRGELPGQDQDEVLVPPRLHTETVRERATTLEVRWQLGAVRAR